MRSQFLKSKKVPAEALCLLAAALLLAACSTGPRKTESNIPRLAEKPELYGKHSSNFKPVIVSARQPLQCVAHTRSLSGLSLRGDAWTWWQSARGRYDRGSKPKPGSILVLSRSDKLRFGHIAYVTKVLGRREILVEHANWLNRGQIHKNQIVRDVSKHGDWSEVRVWYTPGQVLGRRTYPVSGFIYASKASGVST